eukprot:403376946
MEDILQYSKILPIQQHQFQCSIKESDKSKFLKDLLQPESLKSSQSMQEQLTLSSSARKMLETVLKNSNINAVPQTPHDYTLQTLDVLKNKDLSNMNVANIVRALVDTIQYDTKLEQLVINELGFQTHSRIFQTNGFITSDLSSTPNKQVQDQNQNDFDIGLVSLGQFMLDFGRIFQIFSPHEVTFQQIRKLIKFNHIIYSKFQTDSHLDFLKIQESNKQSSLISPVVGLEQLKEAKQYEAAQITKIFEDSQLSYLKTKGDLYETTEYNPSLIAGIESKHCQSYDDLLAHEDLSSINQQVKLTMTRAQSFQVGYNNYPQNNSLGFSQQNKRYPEYNGFQPLLNQKHKQIINEKLQIQQKHQNQGRALLKNEIHEKIELNTKQEDNFRLQQNQTPKVLSFSANKLKSPSLIQSSVQYVGNKRFGDQSTEKLELNIKQEATAQKNHFITPITKRQRFEPQSSMSKGSHYPKEEKTLENQHSSDSEEEEKLPHNGLSPDQNESVLEVNDAASSASRKKRGLKILSVKVQELVFKNQHTTYKDVANELIKQLREKKQNKEAGVDDLIDGDSGDDEDISEDASPNKKSDRDPSSSQQKWEKNVRRRVYDALNVLYAAGVLKKEGKHVYCDKQVLKLTNKLKDNSSIYSSNSKSFLVTKNRAKA